MDYKKKTIEEKAQAYDKAIKLIKENLVALNDITETGKEVIDIQSVKNYLYRAFPELEYKNNKQKSADKTNSKFHKGQWITCKGLNTALIINIVDDKYEVEFFDGAKAFPYIDYIDRLFHLWTIEDAKDGDVLAGRDCFVLFKKLHVLNIECYCTYYYINIPCFHVDTLQYKRNFQPATKEQCDLLFQKVKEYGYEWDNIC